MFKTLLMGGLLAAIVWACAAAQFIRQHVDERPIGFKIGETTLAIPRQYFLPGGFPKVAEYLEQDGKLHPSEDWEKVDFLLCAVWPSLEKCTFNIFQKNQIIIFVDNESNTATGKKLFEIFYKSWKSEISNGPQGFNKFIWFKRDFMFKGDIDEPKEVVSCNQISSVFTPYCDRNIAIGPNNLVMKFSFPRRYLDEMLTIQQHIIDKLNGFRRSGPKFSGDTA